MSMVKTSEPPSDNKSTRISIQKPKKSCFFLKKNKTMGRKAKQVAAPGVPTDAVFFLGHAQRIEVAHRRLEE